MYQKILRAVAVILTFVIGLCGFAQNTTFTAVGIVESQIVIGDVSSNNRFWIERSHAQPPDISNVPNMIKIFDSGEPIGEIPFNVVTDQPFYEPMVDFSPNEDAIAVIDQQDITIYSLPDLDRIWSINISTMWVLPEMVKWSLDGRYLAFFEDINMFAVFDTETETVYEQPVSFYGAIKPRNDGWTIASTWYEVLERYLVVCDVQLDSCYDVIYSNFPQNAAERALGVASPDGKRLLVITREHGSGLVAVLWQLQTPTEFMNLDIELHLGDRRGGIGGFFNDFSPEGRYLAIETLLSEQGESEITGDTTWHLVVWDLDKEESIQILPPHCTLRFLEEATYYIAKCERDLLSIYRFGELTPISSAQVDTLFDLEDGTADDIFEIITRGNTVLARSVHPSGYGYITYIIGINIE